MDLNQQDQERVNKITQLANGKSKKKGCQKNGNPNLPDNCELTFLWVFQIIFFNNIIIQYVRLVFSQISNRLNFQLKCFLKFPPPPLVIFYSWNLEKHPKPGLVIKEIKKSINFKRKEITIEIIKVFKEGKPSGK